MNLPCTIADDAVPCRYCGATHAKPHPNKFGVCASCFHDLSWRHRGKELQEDDVAASMVRRLTNISKRATRNRYFGRCEALSRFSLNDRETYYQCAVSAVGKHRIDARACCASHMKSASNVYACDGMEDAAVRAVAHMIKSAVQHSGVFRQGFELAKSEMEA